MPSSLTPRIAVVLISLAFSVAFGLRALGGSSAPKAAEGHARAEVAERLGPKPDVALAAAPTVPDLKDPRVRHVRKPKPRPKRRRVVVAAAKPPPARVVSRPDPTPASTPRPAAPRYVPTPAPRYVAPRRTPAPTPKATPAPSGEFDTSGGRFDSEGAR
jgi:hypothetical protein